ncbi:proline-rich transmembrane protein 4-like [Gigantopelta aegis]|uniref:proline-rich transmembrane protein 4-like n=1 Tax=Gigantopelta aegis TaxID=1735272 RepID=UPI001B8880C3|nr:proline-rich transmembrane protein 4-like [Gigantopelta aegis]XP_041376499.1 proline-rich transmembrane protein 4-like [Gigantopelta aegis]XP_041376500.1 proline-rich transmembrane protein 4-like [Gigantopelta aegis]XP_041376501.1 proline-rich transmembrane protein 4-like [Gigantopelta aegis]
MSSTSEPKTEPISEGESSPEPSTAVPETTITSEPETSQTEPEPQPEIWPEPGPDWPEAFSAWGVAWPLHVYIIATIFTCIAILAVFLILANVCNKTGQKKSTTTISLNSMVAFFTGTRACVLFMDPYSQARDPVPFIVSHIVWSVGLPGLTASFSIVFLILLDTTKMEMAPPKFQRLGTIAWITGVHLGIVLAVDLLVMYVGFTVKPLLLLCQALFIAYGLTLSIGFLYTAVKIRGNLTSSGQIKDEQTERLWKLTRTIGTASVIAMAMCVTYVYSAVSEFGVLSDISVVDPWSWWSLQTLLRLEEIACSLVVVTIFVKSSPTSTVAGYLSQLCPRLTGKVKDKAFLADKSEFSTKPTKEDLKSVWVSSVTPVTVQK